MKKVFTRLIKATKILLLLALIFSMTRVNTYATNGKITNDSMNKTLDLTAMATKYDEIHYTDAWFPLDTFTGDLTGYGADCALCSGKLGCTGQDVRDGTTTYNDPTYGTVNIVASSKNLKCGSIITWDNYGTKMTAIVLDRGVLGTDIDLLSPSESYASDHVGRHKITYDVLRNGWSR
jgi:hypothetical protein